MSAKSTPAPQGADKRTKPAAGKSRPAAKPAPAKSPGKPTTSGKGGATKAAVKSDASKPSTPAAKAPAKAAPAAAKAVAQSPSKPAAKAAKGAAATKAKPAKPAKAPAARKAKPASKPVKAAKVSVVTKPQAVPKPDKAEPQTKPAKAANAPASKSPATPATPAKPRPVKAPPAAPVVARKSSLVDYDVPPPPVRPPFVPPKAEAADTGHHKGGGRKTKHSPEFIQKQRDRLMDLRERLLESLNGMARDTIRNAPEGSEASGSGQHQGDAGSDAYDRDFALSVLAKEQDSLYEIDQALRRIQKGTYGICEMSEEVIPQARLEAIPFARLTVACQAQWEKEYGNRRFRPSDEVGFSGGNLIDDEDSESISLDEDEE